jgi:TolA-binding protein
MKTQFLYRWLMVVSVLLPVTAIADTWHLDSQTGWQNVADLPQGEYLLAISKLKQQLVAGDVDDVLAALETLKKDYPDLAGGDLDAFIEAEQLYAKGKLAKAGKLYKGFLETWPDSPFQPIAMERYFSIGAAYLQGQKRTFLGILKLPAFDDGVTIMRVIADKAGNSPIALRALQVTAENQERRKKFIDAYHSWAEISIRWPTGAEGRDALLRMGRALHASYGGADYDATVLNGARSYFEDFIARYPQIAEELKLADTLTLITEQLAYKHYEVGFYYEKSGNVNTAHKHYRETIAQWPGTSAAQMAASRLAPNPAPAVKATVRRKAFDAAGGFLDNWFGLKLLFDLGKKTPQTEQS